MGRNVLIYCMTSMLHELLKKTFLFTYDATMTLYNITSSLVTMEENPVYQSVDVAAAKS